MPEVRLDRTPHIFSICRAKKKECKIKRIATAHSHCSCQNTVLGGEMAPNRAVHCHNHVGNYYLLFENYLSYVYDQIMSAAVLQIFLILDFSHSTCEALCEAGKGMGIFL